MHKFVEYLYTSRIKNISCVCGHCGNKVSVDVTQKYNELRPIPTIGGFIDREYEVYNVGQCPECGKPVIYDVENDMVIPYSCEFGEIKHLPEDIETLFSECKSAYSCGAYSCCVVIARTILMHIAVDNGAAENLTFAAYVDYLVNNFLPREISKPWVDKIRKLGNDSVHKLVIATKENAHQSLTFLIQILKIVYELPNEI